MLNSPILQAYKTIQTASNTDMMLKQQLTNLPNGEKVLEALEKCGGNYEKATLECLKQFGLSVSDLTNIMKNVGY